MRRVALAICIVLAFSLGVVADEAAVNLDAIKKKGEPIAENILDALKNKDYQRATKDFSEEMLKALGPEEMKLNEEINIAPKIGTYESKVFKDLQYKDGFYILFYEAKFSKEDKVIVKVVFKKDDPAYKVQGLWYDSPKLRGEDK